MTEKERLRDMKEYLKNNKVKSGIVVALIGVCLAVWGDTAKLKYYLDQAVEYISSITEEISQ